MSITPYRTVSRPGSIRLLPVSSCPSVGPRSSRWRRMRRGRRRWHLKVILEQEESIHGGKGGAKWVLLFYIGLRQYNCPGPGIVWLLSSTPISCEDFAVRCAHHDRPLSAVGELNIVSHQRQSIIDISTCRNHICPRSRRCRHPPVRIEGKRWHRETRDERHRMAWSVTWGKASDVSFSNLLGNKSASGKTHVVPWCPQTFFSRTLVVEIQNVSQQSLWKAQYWGGKMLYDVVIFPSYFAFTPSPPPFPQ